MSGLPLTGQELGWLRDAPPVDDQGQRVPWSLSDRVVRDVEWRVAVVHEDATFERLEFATLRWHGPTFRRCVFRDVHLTRAALEHVRFEDVTFENCTFEGCVLERAHFERCRFVGGAWIQINALHSAWHACALEGLALTVATLRECDLSGSVFRDAALSGLRASKLSATTLEVTGGELRAGDWTACRVGALRVGRARVDGLRLNDGEFESAVFSNGAVANVSVSGTAVRTLAVYDAPTLATLAVVRAHLGELRLENCPDVSSLLVADTRLERVVARNSVLFDAAFERPVGDARIELEQGGMTGVLFDGGAWAAVRLSDARVDEYLTVKNAHFGVLEFQRVSADAGLALRLEGDTYGAGSPTWRDIHG